MALISPAAGERFTCPVCHRSSSEPADLANGYCGACHWQTGGLSPFQAHAVRELVEVAGLPMGEAVEAVRMSVSDYRVQGTPGLGHTST